MAQTKSRRAETKLVEAVPLDFLDGGPRARPFCEPRLIVSFGLSVTWLLLLQPWEAATRKDSETGQVMKKMGHDASLHRLVLEHACALIPETVTPYKPP